MSFPEVCDKLNIEITLQRGSCDYADTVFDLYPSLDGIAVHRDLLMYTIKFQNCSGSPWRLSDVQLDLKNRLLLIDNVTSVESVLDQVYLLADVNDTTLVAPPLVRVLSATVDENCGTFNPAFGGGLNVFNGTNAYGADSETRLFNGLLVIEGGECCLNLILAVDQDVTAADARPLIVEKACLSAKGIYKYSENGEGKCVTVQKSIKLPGDCSLRLDRNSVVAP